MARIQFEVPEGSVVAMDELQERLGLSTRKDLFNNAITLLDWAAEQRRVGRSIASIDKNGGVYRELIMPSLQLVESKST